MFLTACPHQNLAVLLSLYNATNLAIMEDPNVMDDELSDVLADKLDMSRSSMYKWVDYVGINKRKLVRAKSIDFLLCQTPLIWALSKDLRNYYCEILPPDALADLDEIIEFSTPQAREEGSLVTESNNRRRRRVRSTKPVRR